LCRNQTGFPGVPVPDENAFPYGRFRSRNIKNDYAAERHVTDRREDQVNLYIRLLKLDSFITNLTHSYQDRYLGLKFNHITWTQTQYPSLSMVIIMS
jgi:hypothetical protein